MQTTSWLIALILITSATLAAQSGGGSGGGVPSPQTYVSAGPAMPPAGSVVAGATRHACLQVQIARGSSATSSVTLTGFGVNNTGTSTGIEKLSIWLDANGSGVWDAGETLLAEQANPSFPHIFSNLLGFTLAPGQTGQVLATVDVASSAQPGGTIHLHTSMSLCTFNPTGSAWPSNGVNGEVQTIAAGPTPAIAVTEGGAAINPGDQATGGRAFGAWLTNGGACQAATIMVQNTGSATLTLGQPQLTGSASEFVLTLGGFGAPLGPGQQASFEISFDPASAGNFSATVEFTHNVSGVANPFTFEVTGTGVDPTPALTVTEGGMVVANGAPAAGGRDFGTVDVANMPTTFIAITISNSGSADLVLGTPGLLGFSAADFVLDLAGFATTVAPSMSTSFGVAFDATILGGKTATIEFMHNDASSGANFSFGVAGLAVSAVVPLITTTTLPDGNQNLAYGPEPLVVQGGVPGYSFMPVGAMPPGIQVDAGGNVFGTPTAPGTFQFTVRVQDSIGAFSDTSVSLYVEIEPGNSVGQGGESSGGCAAGAGASLLPLIGLLLTALRRRRR